jgi:hypothetical protein
MPTYLTISFIRDHLFTLPVLAKFAIGIAGHHPACLEFVRPVVIGTRSHLVRGEITTLSRTRPIRLLRRQVPGWRHGALRRRRRD